MESDSLLITLFVIVVALLSLLGAALYILHYIKKSRGRRVLTEIEHLRDIVRENNRRIQLIETHAIDYFNSMPPETRRAFALAREMILAIEERIQEIESLIAAGDHGALLEAEELLNYKLERGASSVTTVAGAPEIPAMYREKWAGHLDHLFQQVGRDISKASAQAYNFNITKRKRQITVQHLVDAGVHFMTEQGRRLTGTFRRQVSTRPANDKDQE